MSLLELSQNITKMRKERKITQEELAEFVGVTKGSVSKWETGTTTPDIQILPVLAAYFDVSVDDLLGYQSSLSKKQIKVYYHKLAHEFANNEFDEVWEKCNHLIKKYYGCYPFLLQMAILYLNHSSLAKTQQQKQQVLMQAESLCFRVAEGSKESSLCEKAVTIRGLIWLQQGKCEQIINSMEQEVLDVNRIGDKGDLLPMAYIMTKNFSMARKSCQIGLYRHLMELMSYSTYLLISEQNNVEYCEKIIERTDRIIEAYELEKLQPNTIAGYHFQVAVKMCEMRTAEDKIYDRIENYVRMICQLYKDGIKIHADSFFYELEEWFKELELGVEAVRDKNVILTDSITSLQHPAFSKLQDSPRLKKCMNTIQKLINED